MMKFFIAALAVLAVFASASAFVILPDMADARDNARMVGLEDVDTDGGIHVSPSQPMTRHRRLTCDLFSFSSQVVTPNHAACALKCVGKGRGGGHCEGTKCVCRDDKWTPW